MNKIIAMILACLMVVSLAACKNEVKEEDKKVDDAIVDVENKEEVSEEKEEIKEEVKEETKKPVNESKPQVEETKKPATENKPQVEENKKPAQENKPQVEETNLTLGNTLLKDFKAKAASMDVLSLAEALIQNPEIKFMGGAMAVEEGYLSGFDNVEITGFKEGATFMPMIGSIAFVGYVFELENASDVPAFIANLEKNANKRWNICVEADEMVTGSVNNKVFFVMCPTAIEE